MDETEEKRDGRRPVLEGGGVELEYIDEGIDVPKDLAKDADLKACYCRGYRHCENQVSPNMRDTICIDSDDQQERVAWWRGWWDAYRLRRLMPE